MLDRNTLLTVYGLFNDFVLTSGVMWCVVGCKELTSKLSLPIFRAPYQYPLVGTLPHPP